MANITENIDIEFFSSDIFLIAMAFLLSFFLIVMLVKSFMIREYLLKNSMASYIKLILYYLFVAACLFAVKNKFMMNLNVGICTWLGVAIIVLLGLISITLSNAELTTKETLIPVVLGVISGICYAVNIITITYALNAEEGRISILIIFVFFVITYIVTQIISRNILSNSINRKISREKYQMIHRLIHLRYADYMKIKTEDIYLCINNDMEVVGNSMRDWINIITNSATVIICITYLSILNINVMLIAVLVIILACSAQLLSGKIVGPQLLKAKDVQEDYTANINELEKGIKEVIIYARRRKTISENFSLKCEEYGKSKIKTEFIFTLSTLLVQLLILFCIGSIAIVVPIIIKATNIDHLKLIVMIFLFMISPVSSIVDSIPKLINSGISKKRINVMNHICENSENSILDDQMDHDLIKDGRINIECRDIEFYYDNSEDDRFTLGPVNCSFRQGNITYIIGGNGSGKSTLLKILLGLYKPRRGIITLDGKVIDFGYVGEYFSVIFQDYYLFDKMFGISDQESVEKVNKLLVEMKLENKVSYADGKFSSFELSSGQRKRLAYVIARMEDRPVFIFDEWAADQDPEFKEYFYLQMLCQLKKEGKTVIVVTHDDRYYSHADKIYQMESGKMYELKS